VRIFSPIARTPKNQAVAAAKLPTAPARITNGISSSQPRWAAKPPNSMIGVPSAKLPKISTR
jgi:hypothetical protein